jgi:hypothetical protein
MEGLSWHLQLSGACSARRADFSSNVDKSKVISLLSAKPRISKNNDGKISRQLQKAEVLIYKM